MSQRVSKDADPDGVPYPMVDEPIGYSEMQDTTEEEYDDEYNDGSELLRRSHPMAYLDAVYSGVGYVSALEDGMEPTEVLFFEK